MVNIFFREEKKGICFDLLPKNTICIFTTNNIICNDLKVKQ